MSDTTIIELYRSLERTIHERLSMIDEARGSSINLREMFSGVELIIHERLKVIEKLLTLEPEVPAAPITDDRLRSLESTMLADRAMILGRMEENAAVWREKMKELYTTVEGLRAQLSTNVSLIPPHPLQGIEVIPKREVEVIPKREVVLPEPLSVADRLLLNSNALKALEAEELGEEEEVEVEEEVEEEEEEELQLEEFEYRGATYYRDPEANVYMTDEDGELVQEPIGTWNAAKQRIVIKKTDA